MSKTELHKQPVRFPTMDSETSTKYLSSLALSVYETIDTPMALSCALLLKFKEYDQLATKSVDPSQYRTAHDFSLDASAVALLKKYPFDTSAELRRGRALEKFLAAEEQCRSTNETLKSRLRDLDPSLSMVPYLAQRKIAKILGDVPSIDTLRWRFGPGSTSQCKGQFITVGNKLRSKIACPHQSINAVLAFHLAEPRLLLLSQGESADYAGPYTWTVPLPIEITDYNTLTFVPKTGAIDRCICVEPHSLVPLQLGYGEYIRRRLRYAGLDLDVQATGNRELAREGSIDGSYATIDLESASDTVSIATVFELLPFDWACALSEVRSPYTKLPDGTVLENEKFSSMGNGFTFELETLIFWCLALSVREAIGSRGLVRAFGDDLIVPADMYEHLVVVLEAYGFTVNAKKSFHKGPFRESCGADWYLGVATRGVYLKTPVCTIEDIYITANKIRQLHEVLGLPGLRKSWLISLKPLKREHRFYGPRSLGDQVIHSPNSETHWARFIHGCVWLPTLQALRKKASYADFPTALAAVLLGTPATFTVPRSKVKGYRVGWTPVTWQELGDVSEF